MPISRLHPPALQVQRQPKSRQTRWLRARVMHPWTPMAMAVVLLFSIVAVSMLMAFSQNNTRSLVAGFTQSASIEKSYAEVNETFLAVEQAREGGWIQIPQSTRDDLLRELDSSAHAVEDQDSDESTELLNGVHSYIRALRDEPTNYAASEQGEGEVSEALINRQIQLNRSADALIKAKTPATNLIFFLSAAGTIIATVLVLAALAVLHRHRKHTHDLSLMHEHSSRHDPLTGLPNRLAMNEALKWCERQQLPTAMLLMDLDRFKEVNDTLGHHYGDRLLIGVADRLREQIREEDLAVRLGGDEFAVILTGVDAKEAMSLARRIHDALTVPLLVDGAPLSVEASIGVAMLDEAEDAQQLLRCADAAMYAAKNARREVMAWSAEMTSLNPEQLSLVAELRGAIAEEQLTLHYQPKVSADGATVVGAEALVRWVHPERGLIAPNDFIPFAESTALIHPLTYFVLDKAIEQAATWHRQGRQIPVAVNLSGRSLADGQIVCTVLELLDKHECPVHLLELEITETTIMEEPELAKEVLGHLHELGVSLSLDDFGAGYTSISQLQDLLLDVIKIDRSLVHQAHGEKVRSKVLTTLIDLSHVLGLKVVAEGVEDAPTMDLLAQAECHSVQGYYVSRPLPVEDFETWIGAHTALHSPPVTV